jgi:hypothetical protein
VDHVCAWVGSIGRDLCILIYHIQHIVVFVDTMNLDMHTYIVLFQHSFYFYIFSNGELYMYLASFEHTTSLSTLFLEGKKVPFEIELIEFNFQLFSFLFSIKLGSDF